MHRRCEDLVGELGVIRQKADQRMRLRAAIVPRARLSRRVELRVEHVAQNLFVGGVKCGYGIENRLQGCHMFIVSQTYDGNNLGFASP